MYAEYSNSVPTTPSRSSSSSTTNSVGWNGYQSSGSPQAGDVPTAVRNLLESTKRLQDIMKEWSLGRASETQVSDVYVQIGTEFNATIHAFAYHQIDLSDIHSIPQEMRNVLEPCLAEDPSPEALASFMPELKQILFKLLKGLQNRQDAWRSRALVNHGTISPRNSR